jgi:hypothetical protein
MLEELEDQHRPLLEGAEALMADNILYP